MNLIETFGAKVGALSETNPQRARALLSAGFRANGVKNKVAGKKATKSDRMLFQLVNHAMVDCLANPQQNVMVSLFTPCEMLHLQGLHPYSCEAFSSYLSGSMAEQPFLRQAEDTGIPNSLPQDLHRGCPAGAHAQAPVHPLHLPGLRCQHPHFPPHGGVLRGPSLRPGCAL